MITWSSRHARSVLVLAGLAAIPIVLHALATPIADHCRDAVSLLESERIGDGRVDERWPPLPVPPDVRRIGGVIAAPTPDVFSVKFRISRGSDAPRFYGSLEVQDLDTGFAFDDAGELVQVRADGVDLPVHWLEDSFGQNFRVRAHFYVLDGRPVAYVFPAGLSAAIRQLVHGSFPVTMFAVRAEGRARATDEMRSTVRDWLRAAWLRHQQACAQ